MDLLLAFREFPASSPSIPNKKRRTGECISFLGFNSPVYRMASNGVSLLNFLAGSQAEHNTVITDDRIVHANTRG